MYRIKVTGYVQYLEGEGPYTSLQNREYGKDFEEFEYVNLFRDASVLEIGISKPKRRRDSRWRNRTGASMITG
jgi:hypothetical protein